tara:strand:+ start:452 stop:1324 length:873 start_codon:yes stop_codon:yes gene_type:complete
MPFTTDTDIHFEETEKQNMRGYRCIFEIENKLRFLILDTIGKSDNNWWVTFKKKKIYEQVEMIKKSDEGYSEYSIYQIDKKIRNENRHTGAGFMLMHDIYYTNLMDLHLIINEYWDETFKDIIGGENEKEFYTRLEFIHRIRNKVMHSKPITDDELRELKGFKDYFNNMLNKVNKDFDQFLKCFSMDGVLSSFEKEIKEHQRTFKNRGIVEQLLTNFYDSSVTEWWWDSKLFLNYSVELTEYYHDVKKVNEAISNFKNGIGTKFSIESTIHTLNLTERCDLLLKKISKHS